MRYIAIFILSVSICFGAVDITSWADLQAINNDLSNDYVLTTDLDENSAGYNTYASPTANDSNGFDPIGDNTTAFTGAFDGQGHTISDLDINRPAERYVGLFGRTDAAEISNLGVVDCDVSGNDYVGGLAGAVENSSTVSNSYSTGSVSGDEKIVGGLAGIADSSTVSNSYSTGSVSGDEKIGGLVGFTVSSTVSNCYSTGLVTGSAQKGGLVGYDISSTVSNSFWDKDTSGQGSSAGGKGKTTEQMQNPYTFYNAGWNFDIWYWNAPLGNRARTTSGFSNKPRGRRRGGQGGYLRLRDISGQ